MQLERASAPKREPRTATALALALALAVLVCAGSATADFSLSLTIGTNFNNGSAIAFGADVGIHCYSGRPASRSAAQKTLTSSTGCMSR